jgi:hypothetical protein
MNWKAVLRTLVVAAEMGFGASLPAQADDLQPAAKKQARPLAGVKEGIVKIISPFADESGIPVARKHFLIGNAG